MNNKFLKRSPQMTFALFILWFPYILWMYSVCTELNSNLPNKAKFSQTLINTLSVLSFITMALIQAYAILLPFNPQLIDLSYEQLMIINAIGTICFLSLMALTPIVINKFERNNNLKESNIAYTFFGIFFWIFGIWDLQKKMNSYSIICESQNKTTNNL